jgi:acetyl esterase/lipase
MAGRGFVGLCIEYRLSQEAPFPAALQDVKCALRCVRARAQGWGVDPARVALAGGSAGGHLALLAALTPNDPRYEGQGGHEGHDTSVWAAVGFNPVVDVRGPLNDRLSAFLGGTGRQVPERYAEASPILHVGPGVPPVLILHGTDDATVPYEQAVRFCAAVRAAGGRAELFTAAGAAHAFFNRPPWYGPALARMAAFLESLAQQ